MLAAEHLQNSCMIAAEYLQNSCSIFRLAPEYLQNTFRILQVFRTLDFVFFECERVAIRTVRCMPKPEPQLLSASGWTYEVGVGVYEP